MIKIGELELDDERLYTLIKKNKKNTISKTFGLRMTANENTLNGLVHVILARQIRLKDKCIIPNVQTLIQFPQGFLLNQNHSLSLLE